MKRMRLYLAAAAAVMLVGCQATTDRNTIGSLRYSRIEIKEEPLEGGLDKAMRSYERFLEATPDSALAPEAIRRLADLKIEKEYGTLTGSASAESLSAGPLSAPPKAASVERMAMGSDGGHAPESSAHMQDRAESEAEFEAEFEKRALQSGSLATAWAPTVPFAGEAGSDLARPGALEAVALYTKLLKEYPMYERNDQVLYQMARAYEELGQVEEAMVIMDRLVHQCPGSHYLDEVQFRRAEHFFMHRRYLDAEDAYKTIVGIGAGSAFFELALYKLGWTFYKQELYEEALHRFIALLDHKVSVGYDFDQTTDEAEDKRTDDTFRVVSLSFSSLGGADSVVAYFGDNGRRGYEDRVYSHLGEFYFDKRRYADAGATYGAFISRNPFHRSAPNFHMRVIEIHAAGGFPSLVLESKKAFATTYGLNAAYWQHFQPEERPDILDHLKTNVTDLANHYHACYQDPRQGEQQAANLKEALHWYRGFLSYFPLDEQSPVINYHLAELLLENRSFGEAAREYEKTAYDYPMHAKASAAGYAAVYAYREHLAAVAGEEKAYIQREAVRSSLKFADIFPQHEKAAVVLGAAVDDLYVMKAFELASSSAYKLLERFPETERAVARSAWLVIGHSAYELVRYSEAETAYLKVLELLPPDGLTDDQTRSGIVDNLAASIYQQGEQANAAENYRTAADHFLRVGRVAPSSAIRASAEFDGATALIRLEDWEAATAVLVGFRSGFPGHPLQPEVTKKIAYVYREAERLSLAAGEYERIETESSDDAIRQEALLMAAELYVQDSNTPRALAVYRRYVGYFPQPVEVNLETRNQIAEILKAQNDRAAYLTELRQIVSIDAAAGDARTARTRYLAAQSTLVLAESQYNEFIAVKLEQPFEANLLLKQNRMKTTAKEFDRLMDYEIGEFTAAATFFLAEIYAHFSRSLMTSERPQGLSPLELEEYELAIEEQAYPFEEQAISVHESNLKLVSMGFYNEWIKKSLRRLAEFVPARYDKPEESSVVITSLESFEFSIERPTPTDPETAVAAANESGSLENDDTFGSEEAGDLSKTIPLEGDTEAVPDSPEEEYPAAASRSVEEPDTAADDETAQHVLESDQTEAAVQ